MANFKDNDPAHGAKSPQDPTPPVATLTAAPPAHSVKYRFIGRNAHGQVEFNRNGERIAFPVNEAVETPEWLAKKLAGNPDFELATGDGSGLSSRRGR